MTSILILIAITLLCGGLGMWLAWVLDKDLGRKP